jgi:hypothetical protein
MQAGGPFFDAVGDAMTSIFGRIFGFVGAILGGSLLGTMLRLRSLPNWEAVMAPFFLAPFLWAFSLSCFAAGLTTLVALFIVFRSESGREVIGWLATVFACWTWYAWTCPLL